MTLQSVQNLMGVCLPFFRKSQIKTLAWAVLGCLKKPRGLVSEIARGCLGLTSLKHKMKRLHRFLSNNSLKAEEYAPGLLDWLLARRGSLLLPLIAMDWTEEHGMKVLSFSLIWDKRAIPFYWYASRQGDLIRSQNTIESNAIGLLRQWMGGRRFVLLADRGFHRTALIRALSQKHRIEFVIRVLKITHVKVKGYNGALDKLPVKMEKVRDFQEALYGQTARVPVRLVVKKIRVKKPKKEEHSTWYLVTSMRRENKHQIVEYYSRRMGIEASYRDWKTALGWKQQSSIQSGERLSRYLLILTMAMVCALVVAEGKAGQNRKIYVALSVSWNSNKSTSLVQLGIWLIQTLSDRETSLHSKKLFRLWGL